MTRLAMPKLIFGLMAGPCLFLFRFHIKYYKLSGYTCNCEDWYREHGFSLIALRVSRLPTLISAYERSVPGVLHLRICSRLVTVHVSLNE